MDDKNLVEIDVVALLRAIWKRIFLVAIVTVLCAVAGFSYARFYLTPTYQATALLYVNNSSISVGSTQVKLSASDISAAQSLVSTYTVILQSRSTLNEVARVAGVQYTYEDLSKMIKAAAVNETEVFQVTVTDTDPAEAMNIANAVAKVLPNRIADILDGSSARVVDYAVQPTQRNFPSYTRYTEIGALLGLMAVCLVIAVRELLDKEIHGEEYLMQKYPKIPVLAVIPDLAQGKSSGYGYYYSSGKREAQK